MAAEVTLTIGPDGQVAIPAPIRAHYGLAVDTQVRLIEVQGGILLVPMTAAPDAELAAELASWQQLYAEAAELFPYDEGAEVTGSPS